MLADAWSETSYAPTEKTEIVRDHAGGTWGRKTARAKGSGGGRAKKKKAAQQGKGGASNAISIDPNSPVPPDEQIESFRLGCQALKAQQAEGQEAVDAYFQEAMSAGTTMAEVLSGRGYECTDEEIHVWQRQD